jgi:hypothetical protein
MRPITTPCPIGDTYTLRTVGPMALVHGTSRAARRPRRPSRQWRLLERLVKRLVERLVVRSTSGNIIAVAIHTMDGTRERVEWLGRRACSEQHVPCTSFALQVLTSDE